MRFLDYQKVKDAERLKAKELFGSAEAPTELASLVSGIFFSIYAILRGADWC